MGRATPRMMEVFQGHLVGHFMLCRSALSAQDITDRFIRQGEPGEFRKLPSELQEELRVIQGLIFVSGSRDISASI